MKIFYTITISLLVFFSGENLAQSTLDQMIAVPLSNPGERGELEINLVNGSINITGYQGDEVLIKAKARPAQEHHKRDNHAESNGLKRIPSNAMSVEVREESNAVVIDSDSFRQPIDFDIQVPENFDLRMSTVNGGNISVSSVVGSIEANNVNGEIVARNISGSALLDTVNGKVEVSFNSVSKDSPMAFTTLNGNVDVTLPSSVEASFKMKSDQGEIYSDFDMSVSNSGPKVDRSTRGNFKVTIENWVYGEVNGGGPEYIFNNMNGNIYIRKK